MAIALECPCGASLRLPTILAGHVGRCPGCGLPLRAPDAARHPTSAPVPVPAAASVSSPSPSPVPVPVPAPSSAGVPAPTSAPPKTRAPVPSVLPRIVRVECECRRLVVAPGAQVAAGTARCPSCDRLLDASRTQR